MSRVPPLMLHSNAPPHWSQDGQGALREWDFEELQHSVHSSDLAPSDYNLFPNLKKYLLWQRFYGDSEVPEAAEEWLTG